MSQQTINVGAAANDNTGDPLRTAMQKAQANFTELYGSVIDGETPSGAIDDVNVTFTLANTPIAGSVKVYLNGVRLRVTTDYTISAATITFVTAPETGDTLLTDYRK